MTPLLSPTLTFLQNDYELLEEELVSMLNTTNELFSNFEKNDILGGLLAKIDNVLLTYDLAESDKSDIKHSVNSIYSLVLQVFKKEFSEIGETIDTTFQDMSLNIVAETIYKYIYAERKQLLLEYVSAFIFTNKATFVKSYKSADDKKDMSFHALKKEVTLRNSDYYTIILNIDTIVSDILTDENTSILEILACTEMSEEESEILEAIFEGDQLNSREILIRSLLDSEYYRDFVTDIKTNTINALTSAS